MFMVVMAVVRVAVAKKEGGEQERNLTQYWCVKKKIIISHIFCHIVPYTYVF